MTDATVPKRTGTPAVFVSNRQDEPVDETGLADVAATTLMEEGAGGVELSLSFVGAEEMANLHERFMHEPGPTDVLSFPLDDDDLVGDVVVCPAEAARNNADMAAELRLLVVHGVLHLLGYDHETDRERREMWARQERYSGVRAS
jgi:probable rRNA maturation factor